MELNNLKLLATQNMNINLDSFIFSILLSIILSFLVQKFYIKFSTTLSNKVEFSKNFLILAATTTIIITIVKSSLALSLGLVGALSIVRFRAAIKEPEELVYLFLIISIGLGCGAGQFYVISVGIILILFIIYILSKIKSKHDIKDMDKINLTIIYNFNTKQELIENLKKLLIKKTLYVKLISLVKSDLSTTINFQVQLDNFNSLNNLINIIQKKKTKVIIAQSDILVN
tara:strand:+ start:530 stop:1216 length:687 start_codon:yes stop_codon:yes gene_type:complete